MAGELALLVEEEAALLLAHAVERRAGDEDDLGILRGPPLQRPVDLRIVAAVDEHEVGFHRDERQRIDALPRARDEPALLVLDILIEHDRRVERPAAAFAHRADAGDGDRVAHALLGLLTQRGLHPLDAAIGLQRLEPGVDRRQQIRLGDRPGLAHHAVILCERALHDRPGRRGNQRHAQRSAEKARAPDHRMGVPVPMICFAQAKPISP